MGITVMGTVGCSFKITNMICWRECSSERDCVGSTRSDKGIGIEAGIKRGTGADIEGHLTAILMIECNTCKG